MTIQGFDFLKPDYALVYKRRFDIIRKIREDRSGEILATMKAFYKLHPWQFVEDFGMTYDPRNIGRGLPATIPFIPFPRQVELMQWIVDHWKNGEDGLVPKSRDTGASWVAIALSCTLCIFYDGMAIGFGSRKEEYVDKLGSPKSLFYKARVFLANLPVEFRAGWNRDTHGTFMRLTFPDTGSVMTGEAGDNIGRGDRTGLYFVDESAHLERPQLVEESMSATTDCRVDMSSVKGMANPFAEKVHKWDKRHIFVMHWRDDPRKTEEWYEGLKEFIDAVTIAQEYDINFSASVAGVVIPAAWVQSAIDAHVKLGIKITGGKKGGLDVADQGPDVNAFAGRHGILLSYCDTWSGSGDDLYATTEKAHDICESEQIPEFRYDADGMGVSVKGDSRKINETRGTNIEIKPHHGSGAVIHPTQRIEQIETDPEKQRDDRTNEDYYKNFKAQAWFSVRLRFARTHRAVEAMKRGEAFDGDPDTLISISSKIPKLVQLTSELSQATYIENGAGKMLIDKAPDGMRSPNMADSVVIAYAPEDGRKGVLDMDLSSLDI
jgi:phage terminase large subunit